MTAFNDTFGIIGLSSENVGIDRRIYTGLTSTNPQLNVSYNGGRVDVYLNGVKLMGNHSGQSNYDYTYQNTGQGSAITLDTDVALVASDTIECIGYVSNSSNTVTTYTPSVSAGNNTFTSISHTSSDLLNVFLNGVLLDSSDYTADASADTVAITSLATGDVVHIQVIGALDNGNFVPASGGTFSGDVGIGQSPGKKLDVGGDVRIRGDAGTLNFYRTTSPTDVATIEYNHSDSALKFWAKNKAINFSSADADQDTPHLYITGTTGDVWVGASPTSITNHKVLELKNTASNGRATLALTANNAEYSNLYMGDSDDIDTGGIQYYHGTNVMDFYVSGSSRLNINSSGNLTVPGGNLVFSQAGNGINFHAHATSGNPSSNLLDDYEEGTWTPVIGGSGGQSGQSYSTQTGIYTKIGDLVCCQFYVTLSTKGTISGSYAVIGNLPFNMSSTFAGGGSIGYWTNLASNVRSVGLYIPNSTNYGYLTFETSGSTAGSTSAQIMSSSNIGNTTRFNGTITYRTA